MDKNRVTTTYGGLAYLVYADHAPEICAPKTPLSYSGYQIWRMQAGDQISLASPPAGAYTRSVAAGVIGGDPYTP